nr:tyrosine-type recombinase/integrase [Lachnospiraceae bacterium]
IKGCKKEQELAFSESEAVKIIRYSLDNADYLNLAIAALITTGLRSGEMLALKVSDIDLDRGIMYVDRMEQTKTYDILDHCKDNSERTVFLNSDAKMIFKKVLSMRADEDTICEFLFLNPNSDDEKLHLRAMDNRLRKIQHILHMTDIIVFKEQQMDKLKG